MVENRNEKCSNKFIWNQFLAELDVKTIKSGEAYNIQSWPTLQMFSGGRSWSGCMSFRPTTPPTPHW